MTIEKARELLGKEAVAMTDQQVEEYLDSLGVLVDVFIEQSPEFKGLVNGTIGTI